MLHSCGDAHRHRLSVGWTERMGALGRFSLAHREGMVEQLQGGIVGSSYGFSGRGNRNLVG